MRVTSTSSIAATGQTTSATRVFHRHTTMARVLPLEAITHTTTVDATIIPSPAHIQGKDSVTTRITTVGRKSSVTRPKVTTTAGMKYVTYLTITVLTSLRLTTSVTSTHPSCMTAVHADWLMASYSLVHVTTNLTARSLCFSLVMASATKIRLP